MSVMKEIPDIFKEFVFPKQLFGDPALCVLGIVLTLGQILCQMFYLRAKEAFWSFLSASLANLKEKARAWKCCETSALFFSAVGFLV